MIALGNLGPTVVLEPEVRDDGVVFIVSEMRNVYFLGRESLGGAG